MESEPILTPREKSLPVEKFSSEEDWTHDSASCMTVSPTHYQQAILAPQWISDMVWISFTPVHCLDFQLYLLLLWLLLVLIRDGSLLAPALPLTIVVTISADYR